MDKTKTSKKPPINFFYDTKYTSNISDGIHKIYNELKCTFYCHKCTCYSVDMNISVRDTIRPTFVIQRKQYCSHCWIKKINVRT